MPLYATAALWIRIGSTNKFLGDTEHCPHQITTRSRAVSELPSEPDLDFARASQYEDNETGSLHYAKRRRSGDSPVNSISTRIEGRFPSLSRRWRDRKRASGLSISTRNLTPSRQPSGSRASSAAGSYQHGYESNVQSPATPPQSIIDQQTESIPMSPVESEAMAHGESIDRDALVSTPLLPPMMADDAMGGNEDLQSPLQSPSVADQGQLSSIVNTPIGTPKHHSGMPTPPLSARPSYASMHQSRPGYMVPSSEIPPIMIAGPNDEWADKLGHANFTIHPEPYLPQTYDEDSRRHLFEDWETARRNYTRHQVRTGEHYGVTSKTYMLTEMKWSGIDASWKRNYDAFVAKGGEMAGATAPEAASEPAPLAKMPSITDPRSEGKFPKLGDEDIVGPMAVAPLKAAYADLHRPRGKRAAFVTFLKEMKIPSVFLGRSNLGLRASRR